MSTFLLASSSILEMHQITSIAKLLIYNLTLIMSADF